MKNSFQEIFQTVSSFKPDAMTAAVIVIAVSVTFAPT
jgi:hypothetical protein